MTPGDPVESNPLPFDCQLYPAPVDTTTHVVGEADLALRIGPNPVADVLHVTAARPLTWTLLDVTGRPVLPPAEVRRRHTIEVSPLPAGVYHLSLSDATGRAWDTHRILIQH